MGVDQAAVVPTSSCSLNMTGIELALANDGEPRAGPGRRRVERRLPRAIERRLARELLHLEPQDVRVPKLDVVQLTSIAPDVSGSDPRPGDELVHAHARQPKRLPGPSDRVLEERSLPDDRVVI